MSRLLDRGPHTVTVYPQVSTTDSRGNTVYRPDQDGTTVPGCLVTPLSSTRSRSGDTDVAEGQDVTVRWRFLARDAPLGPWARIEWNGRWLTPLSAPAETTIRGVRHISCTLTEER